MTSSVDIVSLTNTAVEALEAAAAPDFRSPPPDPTSSARPSDSLDFEPEPVRDTCQAPVITVCKEPTPNPDSPPLVIVDVAGTTTRQRDRTLSAESSVASTETYVCPENRPSSPPEKEETVRIVRPAGPTAASRQKLASRKRANRGPPVPAAEKNCPQLVIADLVIADLVSAPAKRKEAPEKSPSGAEPAQHAALLSAATSAAAAAAVGTQPVLKDIEQRIGQLADKLAALEGCRASGDGAGKGLEERLWRELEVERELARVRESERRREEAQRSRKEEKFQRRMLAMAALQQMKKKDPDDVRPLPAQKSAAAAAGRKAKQQPRLLEKILHESSPLADAAAEEEEEAAAEELRKYRREQRRMATELSEARLKEFEAKLSGELADIRSEFQDLRHRAESFAPSAAPPPAPPDPFLAALPPPVPVVMPAARPEVAERTGRLLERVDRMQENLEQNMAAIERAREAEFFYAVLNDLSGDPHAVNSAVTRIMVDEALKKASKEAQRQVEKEWHRSAGRSGLAPTGPPGPRRRAQAKVDSGLRAKTGSPSPPRSPLFGSAASLVEPTLLRPGQLGNRKQGSPAPYLHFANRVKEPPRSPVMVLPRTRSSSPPVPVPRTEEKPRSGGGQRRAVRLPAETKAKSTAKTKSKPKCRLLNFRQSSCPQEPKMAAFAAQVESETYPPDCKSAAQHSEDAQSASSRTPSSIPPEEEEEEETASQRSEEGTGLELPGWRRPPPRQKAHLAPRPPPKSAVPPKMATGPPRDPLELRLRNRLEDEIIAEVVSRLGHQRDTEAQTASPELSEASPARPPSGQLRAVVQDVVLSEAMRMLRRSEPLPPPLRAQEPSLQRLARVPTPEATPRGSPEGPSEREADDYTEEFEEEEGFEEDLEPRPPQAAATPPFSPRRDVFTPSWSAVSDEEEPAEVSEFRPVMATTPELSPRSEAAPMPTPRGRAPSLPRAVDFAAQTLEDAGVQTAVVAEVQTEAPATPEEPASELSLEESSSESLLPSESMMSDGQWLLDRSEGQQHDVCVDWAMRRQLANAAMVRRQDLTETSITADRTEEGEALSSRRYDPDRDFLLQLLMEQQRRGRAGAAVDALLRLDSQGEVPGGGGSADFESLASMSLGQVPRPTPRQKRDRGDFSASTTINEEALEDTPVRDSHGSLPPGVTRVRESLNSTGEVPTAALLGTQESQPGASELDTRGSDRVDVDLMRYLGGSMNTTSGTGYSEDFTRTGLMSTNQLIQDALQTTDLSGTGDGPTQPAQRRVKVTMPTLDAVPPSVSPSEDDISEISLKP